jgi:aspartate carbamoyltransferase catalytic subunit
VKHLLDTHDLSIDDIVNILDVADRMAEVNRRQVPKVPALKGKTIATVFFETAARRLSADVLTFLASSSSVNKGESLRDTIETLSAMGVQAFVVRHKSSGVPLQLSQWTDASVINAGDGWHQHPTQGLLDAYTITREFGTPTSLAGRTVAIVGDIKHSRVARSNIDLFTRLGARVVLVAPPSLLPSHVETWPVDVRSTIDDVIDNVDVVYLLRMQLERMQSASIPNLAEYTRLYALTPERATVLQDHALLMHPGPMNRGVEITVDPADVAGSRILQQVTNGVSIRMAVLFTLLGGDSVSSLTAGGEA